MRLERLELKKGTKISDRVEQGNVNVYFATTKEFGVYFSYRPDPMAVSDSQCITLFNDTRHLELGLASEMDTQVYKLTVAFDELHQTISHGIGWINLAKNNQKYYKIDQYHTEIRVILNQLESNQIHDSLADIYLKSKTLEILVLYLNGPKAQDLTSCPFLQEKGNYEKILEAKTLLIEHLKEPLTISSLARAVGVNEHNLKTGFKDIYGTSINRYFQNYRLEKARELLKENDFKINEVSDELGYGSTSHFIEAFKRKFGITPKKYVGSL